MRKRRHALGLRAAAEARLLMWVRHAEWSHSALTCVPLACHRSTRLLRTSLHPSSMTRGESCFYINMLVICVCCSKVACLVCFLGVSWVVFASPRACFAGFCARGRELILQGADELVCAVPPGSVSHAKTQPSYLHNPTLITCIHFMIHITLITISLCVCGY